MEYRRILQTIALVVGLGTSMPSYARVDYSNVQSGGVLVTYSDCGIKASPAKEREFERWQRKNFKMLELAFDSRKRYKEDPNEKTAQENIRANVEYARKKLADEKIFGYDRGFWRGVASIHLRYVEECAIKSDVELPRGFQELEDQLRG